jgi:transposase
MIEITPDMRIVVAAAPADFRAGIDGLSARCRSVLGENPRQAGTIFVFRNKRHHAIKILAYKGRGAWVCQFRLSSGKLPRWPTSATDRPAIEVLGDELRRLLFGHPKSPSPSSLSWQRVPPEPEGPRAN